MKYSTPLPDDEYLSLAESSHLHPSDDFDALSITPAIFISTSHVYLIIGPSPKISKTKKGKHVTVFDVTPNGARLFDTTIAPSAQHLEINDYFDKRTHIPKAYTRRSSSPQIRTAPFVGFLNRVVEATQQSRNRTGLGKTRDKGVMWIYNGPGRKELRGALADVCERAVVRESFTYAACMKPLIAVGECFAEPAPLSAEKPALDALFGPPSASSAWVVCSTSVAKVFTWGLALAGVSDSVRKNAFPTRPNHCSPDDFVLLGLYARKGYWHLAYASMEGNYKFFTSEELSVEPGLIRKGTQLFTPPPINPKSPVAPPKTPKTLRLTRSERRRPASPTESVLPQLPSSSRRSSRRSSN